MSEERLTSLDDCTEVQEQFAHIIIEVNLAFRQFVQQKLKQYKFDLTFEMLQVIGYLWQNDGVKQQEIANATLKDKASLTYLIDNLTRRELVYRQEDCADRRNNLIYLTAQGKELKEKIGPWIKEMYIVANKGIPETEFANAMQVLSRVINNLKID